MEEYKKPKPWSKHGWMRDPTSWIMIGFLGAFCCTPVVCYQMCQGDAAKRARVPLNYEEAYKKAHAIAVPLKDYDNQSGPIWSECFLFVSHPSKDGYYLLPDNNWWKPSHRTRNHGLGGVSNKYGSVGMPKTVFDHMMDEVMPNGCRWKCDPSTEGRCQTPNSDN